MTKHDEPMLETLPLSPVLMVFHPIAAAANLPSKLKLKMRRFFILNFHSPTSKTTIAKSDSAESLVLTSIAEISKIHYKKLQKLDL